MIIIIKRISRKTRTKRNARGDEERKKYSCFETFVQKKRIFAQIKIAAKEWKNKKYNPANK